MVRVIALGEVRYDFPSSLLADGVSYEESTSPPPKEKPLKHRRKKLRRAAPPITHTKPVDWGKEV